MNHEIIDDTAPAPAAEAPTTGDLIDMAIGHAAVLNEIIRDLEREGVTVTVIALPDVRGLAATTDRVKLTMAFGDPR